jgi:hypothetical protein
MGQIFAQGTSGDEIVPVLGYVIHHFYSQTHGVKPFAKSGFLRKSPHRGDLDIESPCTVEGLRLRAGAAVIDLPGLQIRMQPRREIVNIDIDFSFFHKDTSLINVFVLYRLFAQDTSICVDKWEVRCYNSHPTKMKGARKMLKIVCQFHSLAAGVPSF